MKNIEIERRFLLNNENWRDFIQKSFLLKQGYISVEKECAIRVRIVDESAWLTLKGYISDTTRSEFEYEIPLADANNMMQHLCPFKIEKMRHLVEYQNFIFEIDEFFGENAPLVVAEIELPNEHADFPHPDWLGEEITSHGHFTNAYLSKHPYGSW